MKTNRNITLQLLISITFIFSLINCTRSRHEEITKIISPSGKYYLVTTVDSAYQSKKDYQVSILIYTSADQLKSKLAINADDMNQWVVGWAEKTDTILFKSSNMGTYGWAIEAGKTKPVVIIDELKQEAEKLKQEKYKYKSSNSN
jgi:hypothetical protein